MKPAAAKALTRTATFMAFVWALVFPALAWACPVCAQREQGGIGRSIALGTFILLPFVVVGTVLYILISAVKREQKTTVLRSEA
jgi:hypothetical protein